MSREDRNKRVWNNYDNWKLASPYENEGPEVFETEFFSLYSTDEDVVRNFDDLIDKAKKDVNIYLGDKTNDLFSLEDYKDYLIEWNFSDLHDNSYDAIEYLSDRLNGEYEDAQERKGEYKREQRNRERIK